MILAFCRLSSNAFLVRIVYAPTPAKPSPTRNAPDIAKSIFHRIFMAWTSIVSATICELKILQSRLPFSKGGGYAQGFYTREEIVRLRQNRRVIRMRYAIAGL